MRLLRLVLPHPRRMSKTAAHLERVQTPAPQGSGPPTDNPSAAPKRGRPDLAGLGFLKLEVQVVVAHILDGKTLRA